MSAFSKEYTDLDHALDEVPPILKQWSERHQEGSTPDPETVRYTQLVLHEWIANLLQHADFQERTPTIRIQLDSKDRRVLCVVTDNSEGFDLHRKLPSQDDAMEELPERGMGLRIINACTDGLSYQSTKSGRYRFEFSIPADHDPWVSMLF